MAIDTIWVLAEQQDGAPVPTALELLTQRGRWRGR